MAKKVIFKYIRGRVVPIVSDGIRRILPNKIVNTINDIRQVRKFKKEADLTASGFEFASKAVRQSRYKGKEIAKQIKKILRKKSR